jgi:sulfur-oxidizing protein SoxY
MYKAIDRRALLCFSLAAFASLAAADEADEPSPQWPAIKQALFPGNPVIVEDDLLTLTTPARAADAAIVPLSLRANVDQSGDVYIEKVYLVIDANPAPVAGTFSLSRINGSVGLSTRVRVNAYSHVRAIAETSDGKLHMTTNFVKASGGCSAPAGTNDELAQKHRGEMKLRQRLVGDAAELQLMISHPNYSGLQIDQLTRYWIPPDYVNDVQLWLDDEPVLAFTGGISISENPSFSFFVRPGQKGTLKAIVRDSEDREYRHEWPVEL